MHRRRVIYANKLAVKGLMMTIEKITAVSRYFYGYTLRGGNYGPILWVEECGLCIGGKNDINQEHEITKAVYEEHNWEWLRRQFPIIKRDSSK